MGRIINEENDCDHDVGRDAVEDPIVCVSIEVVLQSLT